MPVKLTQHGPGSKLDEFGFPEFVQTHRDAGIAGFLRTKKINPFSKPAFADREKRRMLSEIGMEHLAA
jgi:hypothetical protein